VNLLVVGDGSQRPRLEALSQELGLDPERVRFLGFRSDIPNLLTAADFFVLASRDEGLPLALLEAMSHGLPAVSTSVGGVPEVVANGEDGLLVPSGDVAAMAQAIGLLARDQAVRVRLGGAGQRRVEESFSFGRTATQYEQLYYKLRAS
jgi:glycosyltransferase involved in cell wall biosynthesis